MKYVMTDLLQNCHRFNNLIVLYRDTCREIGK